MINKKDDDSGQAWCIHKCTKNNRQNNALKDFKSLTKQSVASPVEVWKSSSKEQIKQQHISFMRTAFPSKLLNFIQFCTHDRREHDIWPTKSFSKFQSPFQQTWNDYLKNSLTKHTGQLSNLQLLFLLLLKVSSTARLAISEHFAISSLLTWALHKAPLLRLVHAHSTRSWSGPRCLGAEAQRLQEAPLSPRR